MTERNLQRDNTLGVPCRAERAVEIRAEQQLVDLTSGRRGSGPLVILGGGSNVVLRARLSGLVCLMRMRGFREERATDGSHLVTIAAGERWHDVVRRTLGRGLTGLENLALIPGSAGAAPIQNIGAYGVELAERLERLRALDPATGRVHTFDRSACRFGYRDSRFKHGEDARLVILDVTLRLGRLPLVTDYVELQQELARLGRPRPAARDVAEAVIRVRRRKLPDPRVVGNAGSFFKNPVVAASRVAALQHQLPGLVFRPADEGRVKLSAAQLIEACGWKGRRAGGTGVWPRHALVLCHYGSATGRDVLALGEDIRADVARRFGVPLELEPQVLGQD